MENPSREDLRKVLQSALHLAGGKLLNAFGGNFRIAEKPGINNLVTEIDEAIEQDVKAHIHAAFPGHNILGEESGGETDTAGYLWVLDPIDGTVNFAHGIPLCCVSLALLHEGEIILGGVYNPMMDEFFEAEKSRGATLNGMPVSVSAKEDFSRSCLVTGFPYEAPAGEPHPIGVFEKFVRAGIPVRRLGSAALDLCWVACGRFDGFWESGLRPWDVAAGYLLVAEAGGTVTDFAGGATDIFQKQTLATNGRIHAEMSRQIVAARALNTD